MILGTKLVLFLTLGAKISTASQSHDIFDPSKYHPSDIINRDVCVIGGGSTGTYAAIRLREMGKSVVVIEKEDVLGGHTNTYTDPSTNTTIDYGVVFFHNTTTVTNYFSHFDIPLKIASEGSSTTEEIYVDFNTGTLDPNYSYPNSTDAFVTYAAQLSKYPSLDDGFYLPSPVPSDLLLPFGDFVIKYSLQNAVSTIYQYAQGLGNLLHQPTLYVFKNFGLTVLSSIQNGFIDTVRQDIGELYVKALAELGSDALISSQVIATSRKEHSDSGINRLVVSTPTGNKLIQASKIVFTIPPILSTLEAFDLDAKERYLFAQFNNSAYTTGILRNTGIVPKTFVGNIGINNTYYLPTLPGTYNIIPTSISELWLVKFGSPSSEVDARDVQHDIIAAVERLPSLARNQSAEIPFFVAYRDHTPFELTVSPEAIEGGFYERLYNLQGGRGMWFTGAAFHTHDSSLLWEFTEKLIKSHAFNS